MSEGTEQVVFSWDKNVVLTLSTVITSFEASKAPNLNIRFYMIDFGIGGRVVIQRFVEEHGERIECIDPLMQVSRTSYGTIGLCKALPGVGDALNREIAGLILGGSAVAMRI